MVIWQAGNMPKSPLRISTTLSRAKTKLVDVLFLLMLCFSLEEEGSVIHQLTNFYMITQLLMSAGEYVNRLMETRWQPSSHLIKPHHPQISHKKIYSSFRIFWVVAFIPWGRRSCFYSITASPDGTASTIRFSSCCLCCCRMKGIFCLRGRSLFWMSGMNPTQSFMNIDNHPFKLIFWCPFEKLLLFKIKELDTQALLTASRSFCSAIFEVTTLP